MTNWIDFTNFGIVCAGLVVAVIGLILTIASPYMEKISRRFFMIFFLEIFFVFFILFSLLIVYIFSDLISQLALFMSGPNKVLLSLHSSCSFS